MEVMKVVWTSPTQYYGLFHFTQDKIYDMIKNENFKQLTSVTSDNGLNYNINWDSNNKFITLEDWRELKINKIL